MQVNVVLGKQVSESVTEVATMPNEVLLSNVGGVLSLWLGVTVMTIIEVIEFIYFIVKSYFERHHPQASTSPSDAAESRNQTTNNQRLDPWVGDCQTLTKVSEP